MQQTRRLLTATLTTLGALALVGASFTGTAGATGSHDGHDRGAAGHEQRGKGGHGKGGRGDHDGHDDRDRRSRHTEDTDHDDGGTPVGVADDGDDRHPSGRDRSVEKGRSGNQGRAESDPDDDGRGPDRSNGGADKHGGPGGVDLADQDGNNGCGNDDDFEDDNEGWCGRPPTPAGPGAPTAAPSKPASSKPVPQRRQVGRPAAGAETAACPAGMVDGNGSAAGGCVTPAGEAPPAVGTCPAGMVDADGAAEGGCSSPAVLGAGVELCPGGTPMGIGCDLPLGMPAQAETGGLAEDDLGGEVLAASARAPLSAAAAPSFLQAALGGAAGALAFTGGSVLTMVLAALLALGAGAAMLWADRRRQS